MFIKVKKLLINRISLKYTTMTTILTNQCLSIQKQLKKELMEQKQNKYSKFQNFQNKFKNAWLKRKGTIGDKPSPKKLKKMLVVII